MRECEVGGKEGHFCVVKITKHVCMCMWLRVKSAMCPDVSWCELAVYFCPLLHEELTLTVILRVSTINFSLSNLF